MIISPNRGPCYTGYRAKNTDFPLNQLNTPQGPGVCLLGIIVVNLMCSLSRPKDHRHAIGKKLVIFSVNDHIVLNNRAELLE